MASWACNIVLVLGFLFVGNCVAWDPLESTTTECHVTEPIYNYTFDFTSLHSDLAHTAISNMGDIFEFNICGNLTKTCNGQSEVSACRKRGTQEYVLGTSHNLTYRNGKMFFKFLNGSLCQDDIPYQLLVIVGCDYTLDKVLSKVYPYADGQCTFYIILDTPKACLPEPDAVKSNTCTVTDPTTRYTYNLMALSDNNYRASDRNGSIFVINVCKPVLYAEAAMCPPGSSVCFIDLKASDYKKMFYNYGTVEANPVVEDGKLLIRHKSDNVCNGTQNYTSVINFHCDKDIEFGQPEFMGRKGCTLQFFWANAMACSTVEPCVAIDPITGFKYNMNSLKNQTYNLQMDDKVYTFGVCSDGGSPCLEHAGACERINGQSTTLGSTNTNLRFNQTGSPYLLYESGAACQVKTKDNTTTTTFWSTKIEFVCTATTNNADLSASKDGTTGQSDATASAAAAASSSSGPKIIENSNCRLLIHYQTKLACQNQITCKTRGYESATTIMDGSTDLDEHGMDLTPLISTTDNYEARVGSSISQSEVSKSMKFYLNVCRPLVPKYGLGCPGGSAACMAVMGQTTPEDEQSLGYPDVSLTRINETSAELKYLRGSPCPRDKQTQLSSTVQFTCDVHAGRGIPVLESIISECHYQFIWPTNVICPSHLCEFSVSTCEIINDQLSERYSVRSATFTDNGKIKLRGFSIDVCGDHRIALTDYSQSTVKVFFSAPGPCGIDGSVNVQLRLVCAAIEDASSSSDGGSNCNLIYTQRTPGICKFLGLDIPKPSTPADIPPTNLPTTSTTAIPTDSVVKKSGSLTTILVVVISILCTALCLGLVFRTQERRDRVLRIFRSNSSGVRYSRVESNEEANLLLDHNGHFTDSDDDMLL